jgi:D-alanine-D-alanine ligase
MSRWVHNKHIAVLMGGDSSERDVSLSSGNNVLYSLSNMGFKTTAIDCIEDFLDVLMEVNPDICFNALHGGDGENGSMQRLLEREGIHYTHSGVTASMNAMNKLFSKNLFLENDINTPPYEIVNVDKLNMIQRKNPFVIKPINGGSSKGVYAILNESDKLGISSIQNFWCYGDKVLIEDYIEGKELTCAVFNGNPTGVMEVIAKNNFYDYDSKYSDDGSEHIIPAEIPSEIYSLVQDISLKTHKIFGCRGVTRSDFRWNNKLNSKGLFILEINTQPGMTSKSLVPELVKKLGFSFNDLVLSLVEGASCNR